MRILVTCTLHSDLDGVSCVLAYTDYLKRMGSDASAGIFGEPQGEVQYFIQKKGICIDTIKEDYASDDWGGYILVDASSMKGMPKPVRAEKVIEIIDHRAGGEPEKEFPNTRMQNELVGAAATLVTERFLQSQIEPREEHALLLYGGIFHNSLNFCSSNTTSRDSIAVEYLERAFHFDRSIIRDMFVFATNQIRQNIRQALFDDAKEFGGGFDVGAYQLAVWGSDLLQQKDEIESAVRDGSDTTGAQWSLLNMIDIEKKQSMVFVTNEKGEKIVQEALGVQFRHGWATLPSMMLRKQIMPRVCFVCSQQLNK